MDIIWSIATLLYKLVYVDDTVCFSKTPDAHVAKNKMVMARLEESHIVLKGIRCDFITTIISCLSHGFNLG